MINESSKSKKNKKIKKGVNNNKNRCNYYHPKNESPSKTHHQQI